MEHYIPQIIMFIFIGISLCRAINNHGKYTTTKYNGWHELLSIIIFNLLLYFGGFYN